MKLVPCYRFSVDVFKPFHLMKENSKQKQTEAERERKRERDRDTETETERERETDRERETEREVTYHQSVLLKVVLPPEIHKQINRQLINSDCGACIHKSVSADNSQLHVFSATTFTGCLIMQRDIDFATASQLFVKD